MGGLKTLKLFWWEVDSKAFARLFDRRFGQLAHVTAEKQITQKLVVCHCRLSISAARSVIQRAAVLL